MFCGKCGMQNNDDMGICKNCGAKLRVKHPTQAAIVFDPSQDDKNRKVGIAAVSITATVIVILGIFLFVGRSYKATVQKFVDAQFNADAEAYLELLPGKIDEDEVAWYAGYDEYDEMIDDFNDMLEEELDSLDDHLGKDWKVSYEITEEEDWDGEDLDDIKSFYKRAEIAKVSAAKTVSMDITIKENKGDTYMMDSLYITLVKIGRSWYLDIASIGNLISP